MHDKISIEGVFVESVNFAMQQNHVPIIKKLILKTTQDEKFENLELVIKTEPEFTHAFTLKISSLNCAMPLEIAPIKIFIMPSFLYYLTERIIGNIRVEVLKDGEVLASIIKEIEILAYDEWSGSSILPEIISAFIIPNNPNVSDIINKADAILKRWDSSQSFLGYQSKNPNDVKQQMAAIYGALLNEKISYCVPPASFEEIGQRVRLCDAVIEQKLATCLDSSLLYASCLEAVGLNSLLIFIEGHVFLGCWLEEKSFAECIQDDFSLITKKIADGISEICVVETTCFLSETKATFDDAIRAAIDHLKDSSKFNYFVDIKRTRESGIRPIPLRKNKEDNNVRLSDADIESITIDNLYGSVSAPDKLEPFEKLAYAENIDISKKQMWERKLLDLSLRNTLINFRANKSTIQLLVNKLSNLEDELSNSSEFQLMAKPKDWVNTPRDSKIFSAETHTSAIDTLIQSEFTNHRIRTYLDESEIAFSVTNLYRKARLSIEENGTNTLYLALGFLKWYESDASTKERYSPVILLPIEIVRRSIQNGYIIRLRDEDPQMNITLLELLRQNFGITISGLDPLPIDSNGIDIKKVFNIIRQAVMERPRWDIEEISFIGLFSFSQFIMWNDLRNRSDEIIENKIVASLISGDMEWDNGEDFPSLASLDNSYLPSDLAVPISADSSQLSAICAAGAGKSFVLHGPPGTGKSQTITNIIANALFQGKSVLFIADKMAALSVVQRRLESIGISPFCLELHSNKARKKDVLGQLENTLDIGKTISPEGYKEKAERIHLLRMELNKVVEEIHKTRHFGISLYDAIINFEKYKAYSDKVIFNLTQIEELDPGKYSKWLDLADRLKVAGKECGRLKNNPLRMFSHCVYSLEVKSELDALMRKHQRILPEFKLLFFNLSAKFGIENVSRYFQIEAGINLLYSILNTKYMPDTLFNYQGINLINDLFYNVIQAGCIRDTLEQQLLKDFSSKVLEYDAEYAIKQYRFYSDEWFIPKMLGQTKIAKSLKNIAYNRKKFDGKKTLQIIQSILDYKINQKIITDSSRLFNEIFGLIWNEGRPDWTTLQKAYEQTKENNRLLYLFCGEDNDIDTIRNIFNNKIIRELDGFKGTYSSSIANIIELWNQLMAIQTEMVIKAGVDFTVTNEKDGWFDQKEQQFDLWVKNIGSLRNWCVYLNIRKVAIEEGLSNLVDAFESDSITEDELLPSLIGSLNKACVAYIISEEKCLADFSGALFEDSIEKFNQASKEFEKLTADELIARLSLKIPKKSSNYANSSEISILQKAIRSGGRMMSIRKLFDSIPSLLRILCPCMLMSPMSVAQYIDPKYPLFDLVVFDEASQLPTCEAVGAIARGKNLIVVGDPNQLPPTSFFDTERIDEDNYDKEDLESVLDDCLALSMPQEHLLWHYRSTHESLIAFSNIKYYKNKLFTFPSPNDLISKVRLVLLDGNYDRGRTKQNKSEAHAIIQEIIRRLRDPILCQESIGVVTFSSAQQTLINDMLDQAFAINLDLEEKMNKLSEPIFIKNLENVQGDERDIILFSIGYGPDENGKVALNFGPLNRAGGWRRLNVAVSRARREMIVYSTLRPEQINLSRTSSEGVEGLRSFLEYAQRGKSALITQTAEINYNIEFAEEDIARKIRLLGYDVRTNIGCSGYRIDIGIVHPIKKNEYLLAIIIDGKRYCSSNTARDRNILQDNVLKGLGWKTCRLWILDWWEDSEKELNKIQKEVQNALNNEKIIIQPTSSEKLSEVNMATKITSKVGNINLIPNNQADFVAALLDYNGRGSEEFCLPKSINEIQRQILSVLSVESPISKGVLYKRILQSWNIARTGTRVEKQMLTALRKLSTQKTIAKHNTFFWNELQSPEDYRLIRTCNTMKINRNMEDISPEEIANAIKIILENQISMLKADLIKETYKIFGFARGSTQIEDIITEGIIKAVERNFAYIDTNNGRIVQK